MASKNAKRAAKNFLNTPIGAILLIIAAIVAIFKLIFGG